MNLGFGLGLGFNRGVGVSAGYTDEAIAYFAATNGDLTEAGKTAINKLIIDLKANQNFSEVFDQLCIYAIDSATGANSLINLISPGTLNQSILNGLNTYLINRGWIGENGKGIDTNYKPDGNKLWKSNDCMMMIYSLNAYSGGSSAFAGIRNITTNARHLIYSAGWTMFGCLSGTADKSGSTDANGLFAIERTATNNLRLYLPDGTSDTYTTNTTLTYPAGNIYVTCRNSFTPPSTPSIDLSNTVSRIAIFGCGKAIGTTKFGQIKTALTTYLTTIGAK